MRNMMKSGWGKMSMAFLGALIYALGINLFVVPLGLITGGMMGFCQLIRSAILMLLRMDSFSFDIAGLIFYALNIPLLLLAYRSLGKVFSRNTLIISTAYTVFLSIIPIPAKPLVDDRLTSCLLGGIIAGIGSGLVLTSGSCGGGLHILGLYLSKKGVRTTVGQFELFFNVALFILCGVMFDMQVLIYSVMNTIFHSMATDRSHRQSVTVQVLIFTKSDNPDLDRFIMDNLHRGITRWEGKGVYTGDATHILCVCMNKFEIGDLREALREIDPKAFFIVQEGVHVSSNFDRRLS